MSPCPSLRSTNKAVWPCAAARRPQVPVQLASAMLMLLSAGWAEARLNAANIGAITALFFFLVLLAATQDIAVDGWALTLLSRRNIGRALAPRAPARRLALQ